MPPAVAPQLPPQVNPLMLAALRARAQAGNQPNGPIPNSMNGTPAVPMQPPTPGPINLPSGGGAGTPTQQVTKAAAQAQSPLMDNQTRQIAKTLIQKLMQHM